MSGPQPIEPESRASRAAFWAARLAEGDLSGAQSDEFHAWLEADSLNEDELEKVVAAWRTVEHYAGSPQLLAMRETALADARRTLRRNTAPKPRWMPFLAAAAVLLVVISAMIITQLPTGYDTGIGERRVVALSDGSKVSLDADTRLKVRFTRSDRKLWLERGRAKFEVAKDPLRPWSVAAGDKIVVATGTAFSVELVENQVRVVLYEGHVALLENDDTRRVAVNVGSAPAERMLAPGNELILPKNSTPEVTSKAATVSPADVERSLAWESGLMSFQNEKLSVVASRMNRYARTPLLIADVRAQNLRISGVLRAGDTESLVQGLEANFGVRAVAGPEGISLYKDDLANDPT